MEYAANGQTALFPEEISVAGVALPPHVIDELRWLGIPLAAYTPGQLQAAKLAAAVDSQVFDDERAHPHNFDDMLHLTDAEKRGHGAWAAREKKRRDQKHHAFWHDDEEDCHLSCL